MRLPLTNLRRVRMASSPRGPGSWGQPHHTMAGPEGRQTARRSRSQKTCRSPDRSLQRDCEKSESPLIADPLAAVNTFPSLVHNSSHTMGAGSARTSYTNRKQGEYHGRVRDWGEVVTR